MNKRLLGMFFFVLAFCLGFTLPSHKGPGDFDRKTINYFKKLGQGGIITAFAGDASLRGNALQTTFWMTEKEDFKGKHFIGNYNKQDEEFTLFCLLDYQQVAFEYNHKKGVMHKLYLKKGREIEAPIRLGRLPKGGHDLIIVAASISMTKPELSYVQSHRANVFVESQEFPKVKFISAMTWETKTENTVFKIRSQKSGGGPAQKFHLDINNKLEEDVSAVALLFHNFKQVDQHRLFFKLDRNREIGIPVQTPPLGRMIFCLKINNPFTILEPKPKELASADNSVDMSNLILK